MHAALVVLDVGSTLVDGPRRGPGSELARALGLDADEKDRLTRVLMTTDFAGPAEAAAALEHGFGRTVTGTAVRRAVAELWATQERAAVPLPGAAETLHRLVDRGHRLAVLSNIWTPYLHSVREHFGDFLDRHVPARLQLFSCREGTMKPDPALFDRVTARTAVAPTETVMIGDSYANDVEPAATRGFRTLWLLRHPDRDADHVVRVLGGVAPAPTWTVRSLADTDAAWFARFPPAPLHVGDRDWREC